MQSILFTAADDSGLSRLDPALLSTQAKMEIAFEHVVDKREITDADGNYLEVADWEFVQFNEKGEVTIIGCSNPEHSNNPKFGGSINFAFFPESVEHLHFDYNAIAGTLSAHLLPQKLRTLSLVDNFIKGTLKVSDLPKSLIEFDVIANEMTGTIDLRALPPQLNVFSCGENHFEGTLDVSDLPETLYCLSAYENKFVGTLDFGKFKAAIIQINLSGNELHGHVDFTGSACQLIEFDIGANKFSHIAIESLPQTLEVVYLKNNPIKGFCYAKLPQRIEILSLPEVVVGGDVDPKEWPADILRIKIAFCEHTGAFDFARISRRVQELNIRGNHFIGSVQTRDMPSTLTLLVMAENNFSGEFDFTTLPDSLELLDIQNNNFEGEPDLSRLPEKIQSIEASRNSFTGKIDLTRAPESLVFASFEDTEVHALRQVS